MTALTVLGSDGNPAGTFEAPTGIFDVTVNVPLIHQVVVAQLAAARQGTHSTKTRGEVRGGGKKPYKQKGTGRARQGSIRAPQFTGGGIVHGPTPHGYAQRTPKKMIAAATRGALSDRASADRVKVVDAFVPADGQPSTKAALAVLKAVSTVRRPLVVLSRTEQVAARSLRNVARAHVLMSDQVNAYDVMCCDDVLFTRAAVEEFVARSSRNATGSPASEPAASAAESTEVPA